MLMAHGVPTQTFDAVWDQPDSTATVQRTSLLAQTVTDIVSTFRVTSNHPIDWMTHKRWYIDLPLDGERSVSRSILRNDRIIFVTLIPNVQICENNGTGWLMELNAFTGGRLDFPPSTAMATRTLTTLTESRSARTERMFSLPLADFPPRRAFFPRPPFSGRVR